MPCTGHERWSIPGIIVSKAARVFGTRFRGSRSVCPARAPHGSAGGLAARGGKDRRQAVRGPESRLVREHSARAGGRVAFPARGLPAVATVALSGCGKVIHLREFGFVTVFRTMNKNHAVRHYAQYDPRKKAHESRSGQLPLRSPAALGRRMLPSRPPAGLPRRAVLRALGASIRNHVCCALRAFVHLELQRWRGEIKSSYALKRRLADEAITLFVLRKTHSFRRNPKVPVLQTFYNLEKQQGCPVME